LHELLLENRNESVEQGLAPFSEKMAWKIWKIASLRRGLMNKGSGSFKTKIVNRLFKNWHKYHSPLEFSPKTFNQMWKEERHLK
ncbi:MAG TPA: [Fe-S]-binding protein, partial [Hanamia sp.]|nr:[Fe-S]-binding protein [Hanamia sp.]